MDLSIGGEGSYKITPKTPGQVDRSKHIYEKRKQQADQELQRAFPGYDIEKVQYDKMVKMFQKAKNVADYADVQDTFGDDFRDKIMEIPEEDRDMFMGALSDVAKDRITSTAGGLSGHITSLRRATQGTVSGMGQAVLNFLDFAEKNRDPRL